MGDLSKRLLTPAEATAMEAHDGAGAVGAVPVISTTVQVII